MPELAEYQSPLRADHEQKSEPAVGPKVAHEGQHVDDQAHGSVGSVCSGIVIGVYYRDDNRVRRPSRIVIDYSEGLAALRTAARNLRYEPVKPGMFGVGVEKLFFQVDQASNGLAWATVLGGREIPGRVGVAIPFDQTVFGNKQQATD